MADDMPTGALAQIVTKEKVKKKKKKLTPKERAKVYSYFLF